MKKFSGKNRLAVIALAVMIGVAGYMSFADAGKDKKKADKKSLSSCTTRFSKSRCRKRSTQIEIQKN